MNFEKPSQAPASVERFNLDEVDAIEIATQVVDRMSADPRFQEAVERLNSDDAYAAKFRARLLEKVRTLMQNRQELYQAVFDEDEIAQAKALSSFKALSAQAEGRAYEVPGPKLEMSEVLSAAVNLIEELDEDPEFVVNEFDEEHAPKTVSDGLAPLPSEASEAELARQALASLQGELEHRSPDARLIPATEMGSFMRVMEVIEDAPELRPLCDFLAQDTPKSHGFKQTLAERIEAATLAQARKGGLPKTADLLKIVMAMAQEAGIEGLSAEKPRAVAERPTSKNEQESHLEALRTRAEKLVMEPWPQWEGPLPPLEQQRNERTRRSVAKLTMLWAKAENREPILLEADRLLSGMLSKIDPDVLDERLLKNRIFTSLLLAAEKKWEAPKPKKGKDPSQLRGALM